MVRALVIVESPTKARTIRKYLGSDYTVEASMGHVRDLPSSAAEVPEEIKGKSWARLAVDLESGYRPVYVVPQEKKKIVSGLRKALKGADALYIATDEDREGESIGWHLVQLLKPKVPIYRLVFHEITKSAILKAIENPRELDAQLVQAQEARRVLDRLVGYVVSPLLWKKIAPRLSAGRVQSVAVRLLVIRERERIAFMSGAWWNLKATLSADGKAFDAQLTSVGGRTVATGRDFDENTGAIRPERQVLLLDEESARGLRDRIAETVPQVAKIDRKAQVRQPYPPFTTSTLQQEANRKLGMSARETMRVAQKLYENGHITYMRTDSVTLSDQACAAVRAMIVRRYGADQVNAVVRRFINKTKGAQEAHEAIRPAGTEMGTAQELKLSGREAKLYDLIWKRTVSTQMIDAKVALTSALIETKDPLNGDVVVFRASGREIIEPGFFRAYVEGTDDPDGVLDDKDQPLPRLAPGTSAPIQGIDALGHMTRPPSRYTEATLVKSLENKGIGRPSTYASIIDTIQRRGYVRSVGRQLLPTFTAMAVTKLLEHTLGNIVDVEFTASMETWLDGIAVGGDATEFLDKFYREELLRGIAQGEQIDPRSVCTITNKRIEPFRVRIGRYGPFIECEGADGEKGRSISLPEDVAPADVDVKFIESLRDKAERGEAPLGSDPKTGLSVYVREGRFGPYVQLGAVSDEAPKPQRASLPPKLAVGEVTLESALAILALPRPVGPHPEDGVIVNAGIGRYGPYVVHEKIFASLKATDDVLTVNLERALELLAEKAAKSRKPEALRELGKHPDDGEPVRLMAGRYGPYVKHNRVNASLPEGATPETLSLDQAVDLLAARASRKKTGRKRGGKRGNARSPG
jgi:DNA topoisomerase-1